MEEARTVAGYLAITLAVCLAVVGVADVALNVRYGPEATVSRVVLSWTRSYPILAFAAGIVAGHLFWPQ